MRIRSGGHELERTDYPGRGRGGSVGRRDRSFLVPAVRLLTGSPFETPAVLAAVLFHGGTARAHILPLAAEYTVVHFTAFIVFGIGSAILLEAAGRNRSLLASLLMLLAVFEGLFVALVMLLGPQLQGAVSWWSVLVGNLLATAVMVGYFFARHPRLGDQLFGPWVGVLAEGAVAGVIGGAVVVMWFLLHDLGSGSNPFEPRPCWAE